MEESANIILINISCQNYNDYFDDIKIMVEGNDIDLE